MLSEKLDDFKAKLDEAIAEVSTDDDDSSNSEAEVAPVALMQTATTKAVSFPTEAALALPIAAVCALALYCVKKKRESWSDDSYMGSSQV